MTKQIDELMKLFNCVLAFRDGTAQQVRAIEDFRAALEAALVQGTFVDSCAVGDILGAAYDFRDAHLAGGTNLKRDAHSKLEAAIRKALSTSPQPHAQPEQPKMNRIAAQKLAELREKGHAVCGVMIQRQNEDGTMTRGAVSYGGMVVWWHPEQYPVAKLTGIVMPAMETENGNDRLQEHV